MAVVESPSALILRVILFTNTPEVARVPANLLDGQ
jgi:hypothetical protein